MHQDLHLLQALIHLLLALDLNLMVSDPALEVPNQKAMVPEGQKNFKSIDMESTKHTLKLALEISGIKYIAHIKVYRRNIYIQPVNFFNFINVVW